MAAIDTTTSDAVLVRTDYSDQQAWDLLLEASLTETEIGFRAFVEVIDDATLHGLDPEEVRAALPDDYESSFVIVADQESMSAPAHPLLVIDVADEPGRTFRAAPEAVHAIDNNLAIATLMFSDFAENVDPDGIFRDFPRTF